MAKTRKMRRVSRRLRKMRGRGFFLNKARNLAKTAKNYGSRGLATAKNYGSRGLNYGRKGMASVKQGAKNTMNYVTGPRTSVPTSGTRLWNKVQLATAGMSLPSFNVTNLLS